MLDSIKVGIPLSPLQHKKLLKLANQDDRWQWVQRQANTGDLRFVRSRGLLLLDHHSYHRKINWDIPDVYHPDDCYLVVELSLPKFWYGHNIHLLYNYADALHELKKLLQKQLHCKFPDIIYWKVFRLDPCYNWLFPSQDDSQRYLDSLKHLHFPRKRPVIYPTSIVFVGATYSFKFYLKLPEFRKHDRVQLLKDKASLEWVNHLEQMATGVLRCEATLKRKYLKRRGINVFGDLLKTQILAKLPDNEDIDYELPEYSEPLIELCQIAWRRIPFGDNSVTLTYEYNQTEASLVFYKKTHLRRILEDLIKKFIGENSGMDTADRVEAKLMKKYKPVKAARLVGFWLYIQRFGSEKAKAHFGHNSYYVAKRELKAASVSLVEPPVLIASEQRFLDKFRLEIPSEFVTNKVDDFRDSNNLLNLPFQREEHPDSDAG